MRGQWHGRYNSKVPGKIILNADLVSDHYEAVAYIRPDRPVEPVLVVRFRTPNLDATQDIITKEIFPLDPRTGLITQWGSIKELFPDARMAAEFWIRCECDEQMLTLRWSANDGLIGECLLDRSKASLPSTLNAIPMSWEDYKAYITASRGRRLLFRGQSQRWRLRTAFHRHGRADFERYFREDIRQLHKHLTSRTKNLFDLENSLHMGAFLGLAQHHGYPTPLLDWTASPYVAAFFAFRGVGRSEDDAKDAKVRIFELDQQVWMGMNPLPQSHPWLLPGLQVALVDALAIENERMIPQQGISMQSNVDDIESYVQDLEAQEGKKVLQAFDIPASERDSVLQELRYMGITAASMFPGLDGICEDLKERSFPN